MVKARIRLTLAMPKCNAQYINNEETRSATLTADHLRSYEVLAKNQCSKFVKASHTSITELQRTCTCCTKCVCKHSLLAIPCTEKPRIKKSFDKLGAKLALTCRSSSFLCIYIFFYLGNHNEPYGLLTGYQRYFNNVQQN